MTTRKAAVGRKVLELELTGGIDDQAVLRRKWRSAKVKGDVDGVLRAMRELSS